MRSASAGASYSLPETVMSFTFDGPPSVATSVTFSTRSFPAKLRSRSPSAATVVKVVCAESTLGPTGKVIWTLAVALTVLPVSAGLMTELLLPKAGVSVSCTVLPTGTPVVVNTTVTGLGVLDAKVISALPVGLAGALIPATLEIVSVGVPATNTGPGAVPAAGALAAGLVTAFVGRVNDSDSNRMRPTDPVPEKLELPPTALIVPPPAIVVARMRIAPPLPPPPGAPAPLPLTVPVTFTVPEEAISSAPPPPPPPEPANVAPPAPPPPPDPPMSGRI